MMRFFARRYMLGLLNGVLKTNATTVVSVAAKIDRVLQRLAAIIAFLDSVREKVKDSKIDDDEADAIMGEGA